MYTVYEQGTGQEVGQVELNGYQIGLEQSLFKQGRIQSFRLHSGNLRAYWSQHTPLHLKIAPGEKVLVRVAALPTEDEAYGLLEFL